MVTSSSKRVPEGCKLSLLGIDKEHTVREILLKMSRKKCNYLNSEIFSVLVSLQMSPKSEVTGQI